MAKSNRIDRKQLEILVDTSKGVDQLGYLTELYKRLGEEAKRTESAMTSRALLRQQEEIRQRLQDTREELGLQGMTVNQLRQYYRELQREHSTSSGTIRANAKKNMIAVQQQLDSMFEGLSRVDRSQAHLNKTIQEEIKLNGLKSLSLDKLEAHYQQLTRQITAMTAAELRQNRALIEQRNNVQQLIAARRSQIGDTSAMFTTLQTYLPGGGSALANMGPLGASAAALAFGAKSIANIEEEYSNALVPLRNLISSTVQYNEALRFLNELADTTGQKFTTLAEVYKNIYATGTQAGFSTHTINEMFKGLINTGATLRLSNEKVELTLKAIEQMMNKGVVGSEELRQQLGDHIPGAYAIMAKAAQDAGISTSGTTEELGKLLEEGKLASDVVLPLFIARLEEAFGQNPQANLKTMAGSANRLRNEFQQLVQEMDEGRAQGFFAAIQNGLANTMQFIRENGFIQKTIITGFDIAADALTNNLITPIKGLMANISWINNNIGKATPENQNTTAGTSDPLYQPQFDFKNWKPDPVKTETKEEKKAREAEEKKAKAAAEALQKRLQSEAAARVKNDAEATSKIFENNIKAIEDELIRKKAAIYAAADKQEETDRELLNKKEISLQKFNDLQLSNQAEVSRQVAEIENQAADKAAKEKQKIERNMRLLTMQEAITITREQEDFDTAFILEQEKLRYQFEIDMAEASAEKKKEIELNFQIEKSALFRKYNKENEDWWFDYFSEQRDKEQVVEKQAAEAKAEREKKEKEEKEENKDAAINLAYATEEAVFDIFNWRLEAEQQALQASHSRELEALEKRNKAGQISDEKYKSLKMALEKKQARELAEIARKQAALEKAQALTSIAIQTAVATMKVAPNPVAMALTIAAGAVQAAAVASKPLPLIPSYAAGKPSNTGPWRGTADAAGGHVAIVHPSEEIVPAAVTATPAFAAVKPMLDSMRTGSHVTQPDITQRAGKAAADTGGNMSQVLADVADTQRKLIDKLDSLRVYFGGSELERLNEMLADLEQSNSQSLIP